MEEVFIKIHGRVQAVGFRFHTREAARMFELTGFVRNAPDNTVEITAQGEKNDLEKFIAWASSGPDHAEVEKLDISWRAPRANYKTFEIAT